MRVKDIMTSDPVCCEPDTSLIHVARLMIDYDCGEIPVVENMETKKPVGVITDRDIVVRTIGEAIDPMDLKVEEVMTTPIVTATLDTSFRECCRLMEEYQIRRLPVVDRNGVLCGILSLADIAKYSTKEVAGEIVQEVSIDIGAASNVK